MTVKPVLITGFSLFALIAMTSGRVYAQTASPSAQAVTQTLKDRVQKVLQNEDGKVEGATTTQSTTFGLMGTLQKVVGSTLQIATVTGPVRIAELDKDAVILRQGKVIKNEDVELNSPVLATGVFDSNRTYHVKRLTALTENYQPTKRVTFVGTLQSMTTKAYTIAVTAGVSNAQVVLPFTTKTAYYDLLDTKVEKKYLKASQQILSVVADPLTATSSALRIYIMTPISTVSATPIQ